VKFYKESNEDVVTKGRMQHTTLKMQLFTASVTKSEVQKQNKDGSDIAVEPPGIVAVQWRGGEPDSSS
jgi:hypothetical protein